MSVVIISNSYLDKYYNGKIAKKLKITIPQQVKELGLKLIFMYNLDYSNNSKIQLLDNDKTNINDKIISFTYSNIEETINELKNLNVIAIIPFKEYDVLDAEYLSNCIGTLSNPVASSLARRNKYIMQEKIKEYGLNGIKQKNVKNYQI
jgi:hypothetical protein